MAHSVLIYEKGYVGGGIELVYDAATQNEYKATYRSELQTYEPAVLVHEPDLGEARPVRAVDLDRTFFFEVHIKGSGQDNTTNALTRLLRWVDGASSPALRHHMLNDALELRLRVQLDGATNYTDSSIKWGFVDTAGALLSSASLLNKHIRGAVVALHLPPYSEGAMITLHNDLSNGDCAVESSTSGLAQDWTLAGTPTYALDTTSYLVNGVSQHISDAGTSEGVAAQAISVNNGVSMNCFAWLRVVAGTVTVKIRNTSDGADVVSTSADPTDSGGNSDATLLDRAGNRWYRYSLSATNSTGSAKNFQIQFLRAAGTAEFYVDAAYFNKTQDTTTVPVGGWVSYSALDSRGDETRSAMGQRNWLDFALIPGDTDAIIRQDVNFKASNSKHSVIVGKVFDGKALAIDQTLWIESDEFGATYGTQTNGSWSTGTGTSDNHYYRFTAAGGTGNGARYAGFSGTQVRALLRTPRHVFIRCRASSTNAQLTFYTVAPSAERALTVNVTATNTWELHDLGALVGNNILPDESESPDPVSYPIMFFVVAVSGVPNGGTVDIDCLWLPHAEEYMVVSSESTITNDTNFWIDGYQKGFIYGNNGQFEPERAGTAWYAKPGPVVTRFSMLMKNSSDRSDLDDAYDIISYVWPRTRQLLGTA